MLGDNCMKYNAVDLFCGIGGLTNGLEKSGINVIAGLDFELGCKYAYEKNNSARFINADITQVDPSDINKLFPKSGYRVLAGCAPCQPFSKYTHRYRKDGYKDDKWRLLYYFGSIAEAILPDIIAMENVPELRNTKIFKDFVKKLKEIKYYVQYKVVYCPDYGVPQCRKRLVLLASKFSNIELLPPTHSKENYITVKDAIGSLPALMSGQTDPTDPMHTCTKLSPTNVKRIKASTPGGTWRDWPVELQLKCHKKNSGQSYPSVYGRMCWDEPSPTITTQFYGYGNGRFGHPEQDRALSLREGAILQSFPPNYQFIDPNGQMNTRKLGVQIGNAVPVELGNIIGLSIINHIKELEKNGKKN